MYEWMYVTHHPFWYILSSWKLTQHIFAYILIVSWCMLCDIHSLIHTFMNSHNIHSHTFSQMMMYENDNIHSHRMYVCMGMRMYVCSLRMYQNVRENVWEYMCIWEYMPAYSMRMCENVCVFSQNVSECVCECTRTYVYMRMYASLLHQNVWEYMCVLLECIRMYVWMYENVCVYENVCQFTRLYENVCV